MRTENLVSWIFLKSRRKIYFFIKDTGFWSEYFNPLRSLNSLCFWELQIFGLYEYFLKRFDKNKVFDKKYRILSKILTSFMSLAILLSVKIFCFIWIFSKWPSAKKVDFYDKNTRCLLKNNNSLGFLNSYALELKIFWFTQIFSKTLQHK